MDGKQVVSWLGTDAEWWETAYFDPRHERGVLATGFQAGVDPEPYQLSYKLDTRRGFVHSQLIVRATGNTWHRELFLRRTEAGVWSWRAIAKGDCDLPSPGAPDELAPLLDDALDCDLGRSPLTNLMPVRRNNLQSRPGVCDLVVAWIAVPELTVHLVPQRYEHLRAHRGGSTVRFTALDSGFTADLELDGNGVVVSYPGLCRRAQSTMDS